MRTEWLQRKQDGGQLVSHLQLLPSRSPHPVIQGRVLDERPVLWWMEVTPEALGAFVGHPPP